MAQSSRPCRACGDPVLRTRPTGAIPKYHPECRPRCCVDGCDGAARQLGMCQRHYRHASRNGGDPSAPFAFRRGEGGYDAVHHRLRTHRGKASALPCVDCGAPAAEWSYNHDDPDELVHESVRDSQFSKGPMAYSRNLEHYSARCVSCHRAFDIGRVM